MKYFYVCYFRDNKVYNIILSVKDNNGNDPFGYCIENNFVLVNFWEISKKTYDVLKKKNGEKS
jgi:hypothetical protein